MKYLLGLDIGTSGVKALLVQENGTIAGSVTAEYPLYSPRPGWTEQEPEEMWQAVIEATRGVLTKYSIPGNEVLAIGLSGQMHSSVFLDESHAVIRPMILWNDARTTPECQLIRDQLDPNMLFEEVCNPVLEGFTLPKLIWLREHEPANYAKLRWLVLPKDYVRLRLTGNLNMEVSDAAGMLMMNVREQKWSNPVLSGLDISPEILPPIIQSAEIAGRITASVAKLTGLAEGTPVVGGGADNACGAVGSGVVKPDRGMVSLGTSGVVLAHLQEPQLVRTGTVHMFNSSVPNEFYMMGVTLSAGLSLRWYRDTLANHEQKTYDALTESAALSPAGSRGVLFLPYLTGERTPHGDGNARGTFVGLSAAHNRDDMVRSVLEGVAFALRDSVELLKEAGWNGSSLRALGGGAKSPLWKEIIASCTGLAIERLNIDEGPAFGAAILAGVGAGVYQSVPEASDAIIKVLDRVEPNPKWSSIYDDMYGVYTDLYPALKGSFDNLVKLS